MLLYLNEYHVAQAVYTLHGDSKLWLDGIAKAQVGYCQNVLHVQCHGGRYSTLL